MEEFTEMKYEAIYAPKTMLLITIVDQCPWDPKTVPASSLVDDEISTKTEHANDPTWMYLKH